MDSINYTIVVGCLICLVHQAWNFYVYMCWTKNQMFNVILFNNGKMKKTISFMNHALLASSSIISISQVYYSGHIIIIISIIQCCCFLIHLLLEITYHLRCKRIANNPQKHKQFLLDVQIILEDTIKYLQELLRALIDAIPKISDTEPLIQNN